MPATGYPLAGASVQLTTLDSSVLLGLGFCDGVLVSARSDFLQDRILQIPTVILNRS